MSFVFGGHTNKISLEKVLGKASGLEGGDSKGI